MIVNIVTPACSDRSEPGQSVCVCLCRACVSYYITAGILTRPEGIHLWCEVGCEVSPACFQLCLLSWHYLSWPWNIVRLWQLLCVAGGKKKRRAQCWCKKKWKRWQLLSLCRDLDSQTLSWRTRLSYFAVSKRLISIWRARMTKMNPDLLTMGLNLHFMWGGKTRGKCMRWSSYIFSLKGIVHHLSDQTADTASTTF